MNKYSLEDLQPEIGMIAAQIKEIARAMENPYDLRFWMSLNAQGWKISPDVRVMLDPLEMGWALDLAFADDGWHRG